MTYLSIVIPAYNEEKRIGATLSKICDFLESKKYESEIIVVDDGSSDGTVEECKSNSLFKEGRLSVIRNGSNIGKGFSVKAGILKSKGRYVLFSDADLSTPIEEIDKLFEYINGGYDVVIGSRNLNGSDVQSHQPWYRKKIGRIFNFLIRSLLIGDYLDTQCGFKLFDGEKARQIASSLKTGGFSFDVEMLYIAKIKKLKVKEVGVVWCNSGHSKVKVFRSSFGMFLDIFRIKKWHKAEDES